MDTKREYRFKVIYPRAYLNMTSLLIMQFCPFMLLRLVDHLLFKSFLVGLILLSFVCLFMIIRRRFFMELNITLGENYIISTSNRKYDVTDIKRIYFDRNRIGLKLYEKSLVPMELCFYFQKGQENIGVGQLKEWAVRNNISVSKISFLTVY